MGERISEGAKPRLLVAALAVLLAALIGLLTFAPSAQAEEKDVTNGNYSFHLWIESYGASVACTGYSGSGTQLILPTSATYNGTVYSMANKNGDLMVGQDAFKNNTKITKVAIPDGYEGISNDAFAGCTALTEVAIGKSVSFIADGAFAGCTNLKTYRIAGTNIDPSWIAGSGIGQDKDGKIIPGVTVYTVAGSAVDEYLTRLNQESSAAGGNTITIKHEADPYAGNTVKPTDLPLTTGPDEDPTQWGKDGTPLGAGATEAAATAALTKYTKETDPKGSAYGLLKARIIKVTKSSLTLKWVKVSGAKKYIIYGNHCGKKNKLLKQKTIKSANTTSCVFKKVAGKSVKKGNYYKFTVVALNKNGKVISTSKIVHAATPGGKYCNDKKVTTAAKKGKATVKVKKTFKLKAKAVPASKTLKQQKHRGIKYESSNKKIATVNAKGVITGKKQGTCYVYAYAQNGVCAKVQVTVK